jgi:DNA-binding LytR/AlgR family response regulator
MKNTYSYIIVDDNPIDIKILEGNLSKLPHLKLIQTFNNPIDAIPTIHEGLIDIIFLDVEMPEMTGISLLNSLEKIPQVILISNHTHYSMDAFEVGVTDFIQKPITFERLLKSVSRAIDSINLQGKNIIDLVAPKDNFIFLKSGRELLKFNINDILYVEALASFTKIFTAGKTTVISESISELHTKFPPDSFLRIHKSYLVPLNKIIGISTKNVILENHKIPMGLSYRESIEKILAGTEGLQDL